MAADKRGRIITVRQADLFEMFKDLPDKSRFVDRLEAIADAGIEEARNEIISKIDDLIWRRKLQEKPYDQLEDIRDLVQTMEVKD